MENLIRAHAPKFLKEEGVAKTRNWRRLTNDDKHMIMELTARGLSHHQIARIMNRCVSSIRLVLRQARIKNEQQNNWLPTLDTHSPDHRDHLAHN